jgi:hypothetical protein
MIKMKIVRASKGQNINNMKTITDSIFYNRITSNHYFQINFRRAQNNTNEQETFLTYISLPPK